MKAGPVVVTDLLHTVVGINDGPRPIQDCVYDVLMAMGWSKDPIETRVKAETIALDVSGRLQQLLNEYRELGRPTYVVFNSSSQDLLQGAAFIEPVDSSDVSAAKKRRRLLNDYHKLLMKMTPDEFEILCKRVLDLMGVRDAVCTPSSGDDGIDFFGRLHLEDVLLREAFPTVQRQLTLWMIGQAKKYDSTSLSTNFVRELVGSVELARRGVFGTADPETYATLKIKAFEPIFYLLFTTGHITRNTWSVIEQSGVVAMDGAMLAAFLADREILPGSAPSESAFQKWLTA